MRRAVPLVVWSALLAGPPASAHERDPLPALWVERALTVPRGWCTARVRATQVRAGAAGRRGLGAVEVRYGVLPRLEVRAAWGGVARAVGGRRAIGPDDPEIGVRWAVLRREPPATSVAVDLGWRAPFGAMPRGVPVAVGVGVLRPAVLGARQLGPVRLVAALGAALRLPEDRRDPPDGWTGHLSGLVQLGPLAPWGALDAEVAAGGPWVDGIGGLGVQLTRGLGVAAGAGGPLTRPGSGPVQATEPRGVTTRLAVEASW